MNECSPVTGATGAQGGATARSTLGPAAHSSPPGTRRSPGGRHLLQRVKSSVAILMMPPRVDAAMKGVGGVFSMQQVARPGTDDERKHGFLLVEAARKAGILQFVHTSVSATSIHTRFPRWDRLLVRRRISVLTNGISKKQCAMRDLALMVQRPSWWYLDPAEGGRYVLIPSRRDCYGLQGEYAPANYRRRRCSQFACAAFSTRCDCMARTLIGIEALTMMR